MESGPSHPAAIDETALLAACVIRRCRTGGPGGQHRNKTETGISITHAPTGLVGQAGERRSLRENQRMAIWRLRLSLAVEVRGYFDLRRVPSALWRPRCRGEKLSVNPEHHDYPALLAEALDVLSALRFDASRAANLLQCTTSQLVKLIKEEPRAMGWVNRERIARGMRAMK